MKNRRVSSRCACLLASFFLLFFSFHSFAQTPGLIVRPAGGAGATVLNPNGDGFSSPTTNGFINTDVGRGFSEVPYKIVPPFKLEPTSDLMRGPGHKFSDLVRLNLDESGMYTYSDGTNLLFRLRLGDIVPGSKGYSILIDADQRFGPSGAFADSNYQASTNGNNGNPGFEFEVVLETNFRVAVYNVDGTSNPTLLSSFGLNTHSQISLAISNVSGTPDYFYDFYVPLSALSSPSAKVTATTPIRISSTTVMSPQAAIGGPKSDIYGYDGTDFMKAWETIVSNQPAFTPDDVKNTGTGINAICTAAPVVNSPIAAGTVTISGTWTQADAVRVDSAKITLYKNNILAGTTTVHTGGTWTFSGITAINGDVFYAVAQATGESACLQSNSVTALGCQPSNMSSVSAITLTCASDRGFDGTAPANAVVRIYRVTATGFTLYADQSTTAFLVNRPNASTRWTYDNVNANSANPCTGGAADVPVGQYAITIQEPGKCESDFLYANTSGAGCTKTATPVITQSVLYTGATLVSGTAATGATVYLFINGQLQATAPATGGSYSFTTSSLQTDDIVDVYALGSATCMSAKATRKVVCFTAPPLITTNSTGNLVTGTLIAGTSGEPAGTTIRLYNSGGTVLATVLVQSGGTWSTSIAAATGTSYYATAQKGSCGISAASATVAALAPTTACATITGTYNDASTSVSGTLTASFTGTVRLYQDGTLAGTAAVTNATSWTITPAANTLYPGGVLTATTQNTGGAEKTDCSGSLTISCAPPTTPAVSPTAVILSRTDGKTIFTLTGTQSGVLYTLEDATQTMVSGSPVYVDRSISAFGNGGTITLTSYAFLTPGTYNLRVSALKLLGSNCGASTTAVTLTVTDNDNDGIADVADIDDDNDGILDANETATYDATADTDSDGTPNYKDATPGLPGLPTADSNSDGILDYFDTDRDGIINQFDLDADNDGIPDIVENGGTDSNNDGKVDGTSDADGDGLRDAVDANTSGATGSNGLAVLDFDGDGVPNFRDLDADADGVLDSRESGLGLDANNNGLLSDDAGYVGGADGWSDAADALSGPLALRNTDGRSKPDYLDIDNDDDGIVDNIEARATGSTQAALGTDTDGDGIDNAYDNVNTAGTFGGAAANGVTPVDSDGDGQPDYRDTDSDNDGFPDSFEGHDTNGDNLPNANTATKNGIGGTADADSDGLLDGYDNNTAAVNPANSTMGLSYPNIDNSSTQERDWREADDADKDGIIDTLDIDDDNDGITDIAESGGVSPSGDADGDGLLNYLDKVPGPGVPSFVDANGDGINDAFDNDRDGIINALDLDSDNDGITDLAEAGGVDTNGDGRVDYTGLFSANDSDNDGLINIYDQVATALGALDTDGDGIRNFLDLDSDGDGIPDIMEAGGVDANNDGRMDDFIDSDGDGLDNRVDGNANNDATVENTAGALIVTGLDTNHDGRPDTYPQGTANLDGSGLPNAYDLDSDGDGITDLREAGFSAYDTNNDGLISSADAVSTDVNSDGWFDNIDNLPALNLPNTDGSGQPDWLDIDADSDGITDNVEAQATGSYAAPLQADSDGDGIDNRYDNKAGFGGSGIIPEDTDSDGTPDYRDGDSDNDTEEDRTEGNDFNGNGRPDDVVTLLGTDADGDGLDDRFDNSTGPLVTVTGFSGGGAGSKSTAQKTNSVAQDRDWRNKEFTLLGNSLLPVKFVSVAALVQAEAVTVSWVVTGEENVQHYKVEKSTDGVRFTTVGTVPFKEANGAENRYSFADRSAAAPVRYYRIRQEDRDGKATYSSVVVVRVQADAKAGLLLYPNPVRSGAVVAVRAEKAQQALFIIVDAQGKTVLRELLPLQKGQNVLSDLLPQKLTPGSYLLRTQVDGQHQQLKFVQQ